MSESPLIQRRPIVRGGQLIGANAKWSVQLAYVGVVVLVIGSAFVRFLASLGVKSPWIAPDEMVYALLGRSFWETGHMHALSSAPFYGFYPVFAGLPLAGLGPGAGLTTLKLVQAVAASSTLVLVYAWARRFVSGWWALAASAITAALPALAYSALIMTESVFIPVVTLALWTSARALTTPSRRNQLLAAGAITLAVAIRLQRGAALLPAIGVAIFLFAWFERDARWPRRFVPLAVFSAIGLMVVELGRRATEPDGSVVDSATHALHRVGDVSWTLKALGGLLVAVAVAAVLLARSRRDATWPRRFAAVAVVVGIGVIVLELGRFAIHGGGYGGSAAHAFDHDALSWALKVLGDLFLLVVGVPLIALCALVATRLRDRRADPELSALLAVAVGYIAVTVVETGAYLSLNTMRIQERYVVGAAPVLFVIAVVWLGRGMPRPQPATSIAALVVCAPALLLPVRHLAVTGAIPDSFMLVPLIDLAKWQSVDVMVNAWPIGAALCILLVLLLPRRFAPLLVGFMVFCLAGASVLAQRSIESAAAFHRADFFGGSPTHWISDSTRPAVYVDDGDPRWNDVLQQIYWNPSIKSLALLKPSDELTEGIPVQVRPDGVLAQSDGEALPERLVVASSRLTLVGRRIAHIDQGLDEPGLALWRTSGPPRVSTWASGFSAAGEIGQTVKVTVYDCRSGSLRLTLAAQSGPAHVDVSFNNLKSADVLARGHSTRLWIPVQGEADDTCVYYISPRGTVGLSGIAFDRGAAPIPTTVALHRLGAGVTQVATNGSVAVSRTPASSTYGIHAGYCLRGQFLQLGYNQPRIDPEYKGATIANFVAGQGLTCAQPPPGYVRHGFATSDLGVPPGIYPYYSGP